MLTDAIDYFLFLDNKDESGHYKTFANQNICLALYKNNRVTWDRNQNHCLVEPGRDFTSRLYGFHKLPFNVRYMGEVEQVCIIFKTICVSQFSKVPIDQIEINDDPVSQLFGPSGLVVQEKIFSTSDRQQQVDILENFLLRQWNHKNQEDLAYLNIYRQLYTNELDDAHAVKHFTQKEGLDPSTLYRNFKKLFGQSPKEIQKVIRFRKSLHAMLSSKRSWTDTAYANNFADQSHLIKDFKKFTGESPIKIVRKLSEVQGTMIWSKPG